MTRGGRPDRHRGGARRTSAQPLAASWHPGDPPARGGRRRGRTRPRGLRGFLSTYGWRIYAVPLLVAVTVFTLVQTTGESGSETDPEQAATAGDPATSASEAPREPDATERPAVPLNLNIPTAELPNGGPYAQSGEGVWDIVPGRGKRLGTRGELFTYTIEVERGIDLRPYGGVESFAALVDWTLAEPRSWAASGQVSVQRVDSDADDPDIRISLATPETVRHPDFCGYSIKYEASCWRRSERRVMINLARWVRGALAFGGDIGSYRSYVINHEIGHAFGNGHVGCAKNGDLAPVMMQQSFGVANDYVAQLNDSVGNADPVPADGKVCRYNAWPNPQARPTG